MQMYYARELQQNKQDLLNDLIKKKKNATIRERRLHLQELKRQEEEQEQQPEIIDEEEETQQLQGHEDRSNDIIPAKPVQTKPQIAKGPAQKYIGEFLANGGVYRCYPRHVNDDPRAILRLEVKDIYNDELFALAAGRRSKRKQQQQEQQQLVLPVSP